MQPLGRLQWIAIAAHRLHHRWRTVGPDQLDEIAAELWERPGFRGMEPERAADAWLAPLETEQALDLARAA
ncbi:MAG: hypothetical protein JSR59_21730 [Proteobacteria bacterium]|nr:hypothetical protein [Pseudomonadota bacterium]